MDYLLVAVLKRLQPCPRSPACHGSGLRPPPSQLIENHYCGFTIRDLFDNIEKMEIR